MSWWVYLNGEDGEPVEVERHAEGGTYAVGGVPKAELNVTYNYGTYYRHVWDTDDSLRYLDGETAEWFRTSATLWTNSGRNSMRTIGRRRPGTRATPSPYC